MSKSNVLQLPVATSLPGPGEVFAGRVQIANLRKPSKVRSFGRGFLLGIAAAVAAVALGAASVAIAQPVPDAAVALVDAAPSSPDASTPAEAGSGVGTTTPAPHETLDNPFTNPGGAFEDAMAAKRRAGWPLLAIAVGYMLLLGAESLKWIKQRKTAHTVVLSAIVIAGSMVDAAFIGGDLWAVLYAGVGGALLLWRGRTTAPPVKG